MTDISSRLPEILPLEKIRETEEQTFIQIEYDNGTTSTQKKYVPNKAPILELENITGVVNGESFDFTRGVDFELLDEDEDGRLETIDFSIGGEDPDPDSTFEITYIARSVLVRYVESYENELHQLDRNIDYVIDSHYPRGATDTRYIDDFEDEELVEYRFEMGSELDAIVQQDTVYHGDWGLELRNVDNTTCTRLASLTGLWTYPQRGDTIELPFKFTDTDDELSFDFMYEETTGNSTRYYRVTLDAVSDDVTIRKDTGANKSSTTSVSLSSHIDEWLIAKISIGAIDTIEVEVGTIYDSSMGSTSFSTPTDIKQTLGTAQIVDGEYTTGGIRLELCNSSKRSTAYIDGINVFDRQNTDLDNIGSLFGELGRRRGRDDQEYATFLRSIVQSFAGRGTVSGIRFAVAAALDIDPSQVTINEDFQDNEYEVVLNQPFPPHKVTTVTDLADLADPSGVNFETITYGITDEEVGVDDSASFTVGFAVSDELGADDTASTSGGTQTADDLASDDTVTSVAQNSIEWNDVDWNDFNWATEHN